MENVIPFIESSQSEFIIGLIVMCIILMILLFITMINLSFFKSKYKKLNKGTQGLSFDEHILSNKKEIEVLKKIQSNIFNKMEVIDTRLENSFSKITMHKYDAFENQGGKLSFVLILLNDHNNGFVLHNIHNNDFSYLYSKNVVNGVTQETLTKEEKELLLKTISK